MSTSGVGSSGGMNAPDLSFIAADVVQEGAKTTATEQTKQPQAIKDSIQSNEAEFGQQVESYQAPASKPALAPSVTVPGKNQEAPSTEDAQQEQFMKMAGDLSPELRSQLLKDMGKPEAMRDPELMALEQTLNSQAEAAVWAQGTVSEAPDPELVNKLLQEGGDNSEALQKLLGKPTLTKSEANSLKEALAKNGKFTPEQQAAINAKLTENGFQTGSIAPKVSSRYADPQEAVEDVGGGGKPAEAEEVAAQQQAGAAASAGQEPPTASIGPMRLDPIQMSPEVMNMAMRQNGLKMLENQTQIIKSTIDALPAGDPNRPILSDFLKFIGEIIAECKKFLHQLATMDAEESRKAAIGTREAQTAKLDKQMAQIEKAQDMKKKTDTLSTVMKIAGPIIAIAMVALVIVTGGGAIAIAIAVLMVVFAIIASTTTIVEDVMKEVTDVMVDMFKDMGMSEEMAQIMTMIVMIMMIIALFVVTRGAAAQGTGMVVNQLGAEAAKQASSKVATAVAFQVAATAVTHSNALQLGLKPLLVDVLGMDESTAQIVIMIVSMIVMLTLMMGSAGALASAGQAVAQSAAGTMGRTAEIISQQLQTLSTATQALTQGYSAVANLNLADMAKDKAQMDKVIEELDTVLNANQISKEQRQKGIDGLMDLASFYSQSFDQLIRSHQKILRNATAA